MGHKIALVSDWYFPMVGGVEHQIRDLAVELTRRGHEVHVLTSIPGAPSLDGVRVHRLDVSRIPYYRVTVSPRALGQLERIFRAQCFDVVHGHGSYSPLAYAAVWVARRLGIASVLSSHNVLGPRVAALAGALVRRLDVAPDQVTAVSALTRREMEQVFSRPAAVVPNGIDLSAWRVPRRVDGLQVVSAMRYYVRKAPHELVHAIPQILAGLPAHLEPRFVLAGDGPHRARLERFIARAGLADRVRFPGTVSHGELRRLFAQSQLFIHANVKEAFGLAALEARASGLPVVAMRASGVRELVEHERTGLLADDRADWVGCVRRLLLDGRLRAELTARSGEGLDRFSLARVADRYLDVYAQARGEPARRSAA